MTRVSRCWWISRRRKDLAREASGEQVETELPQEEALGEGVDPTTGDTASREG